MSFDPGSRPPPRHPLGGKCGVLLLLMPAWPLFVAAHLLRRHLSLTPASSAVRERGVERGYRPGRDAAAAGSAGPVRPDPPTGADRALNGRRRLSHRAGEWVGAERPSAQRPWPGGAR